MLVNLLLRAKKKRDSRVHGFEAGRRSEEFKTNNRRVKERGEKNLSLKTILIKQQIFVARDIKNINFESLSFSGKRSIVS